MTKKELVTQIKGSRLYKLYHNPTNEISRDAPEGVNATGQATDRMMQLQRAIKNATMRETDFPPELRNDADELRELIQTGIVTLFQDSETGDITPADFKVLFTPLVGMTEGMLAALNYDDPDRMMNLRLVRTECADKAFYRQLRKSLHEGAEGRRAMFALGKALSSFGTHLFIRAEKAGHLPTSLVEEVQSIVDALNKKAARGEFEFSAELDRVRGWGLVEQSGLPSKKPARTSVMEPVKVGQQMPASQSRQPSGLKKGTRSTAKHPPGSAEVSGPGDDQTSYKPGGGQKSAVTPPQLAQSPGNPKNLKPEDGPEPKQKGDWMDGGLKDTIDGQKDNEPKKESVEFMVRIPKKPGLMEWNIRVGARSEPTKIIGEAWRRVFLGGSEHQARIMASDLATALNESAGIPGEGIKVEATDIFELQLRVVEELNKLAEKLGQDRRFKIAR